MAQHNKLCCGSPILPDLLEKSEKLQQTEILLLVRVFLHIKLSHDRLILSIVCKDSFLKREH